MKDTASSPQIKLVALDSILSKEGRKDLQQFINNSIAYIELAKELDSIKAAAKKMISLSYTLTSHANQPEKAVRMIDELLARKYKIKDSFLVASLYLKRGGANYRLNLEKAIEDYQEAIENFPKRDSIHLADAFLFSGQAYSNLGKFVPAGEYYQKAYNYFEALGDYEYMVFAQQGITTMYSMNGFYEKAKEEREKNIKKIQDLGLQQHLLVMYYNQALDYKKLGNNQLHLSYLKKAYDLLMDSSQKENIIYDRLYVFSKLIDHYLSEGNIKEAEKYFQIVRQYHNPEIKDLIYVSHYSEIRSRMALFENKLDTALFYATKKQQAAQSMRYEEDIIASKELLSEVFTKKGSFQKALEYRIDLEKVKDSIYNRTTANSLAYYQTLYETEKKERELIAKNTNIQLLEKDNEAAKKRFLFISIALALFFGLVLVYRNRMVLKNKKILQEKFSQELLLSQEEERKRISKDLHDGLGQQLLLLKNKLTQTQDTETQKLAENAIEEVRGISRDLHPFQLQELGITKAIEMSLNQVDENTTLFISSDIENIDHIFSKKQEVNLYRIVQESLNNIIKHAKAEAGKVTIKRTIDAIILEIKDNGIGFDFSEEYQNVQSLGLKTLLERTKFLKGQMKVTSKKNEGTTLSFKFPTV